MSKLSLIHKHPSQVFEILDDIPLNRGWVSEFKLAGRNLSEIYQGNITITPDMPKFNSIIEKPWEYGFRWQTDYYNLAFIIRDCVLENEILKINLVSTIYDATKNYTYPQQNYSGSLATFLANFNSKIVFTPLGDDTNIVIQTGLKNDFDCINEAIRYPDFFEWRENGVITSGGVTKTQILYGDFRSANALTYYNSTNDVSMTPAKANNWQPNISKDENFIYIDNVKKHFSFNYVNKIFPFVGSNANENELLDINGVTPNKEYPVLSEIKGGKTFYYIQDPYSPLFPVVERFENYFASSGAEGASGTTEITFEQSKQRAYFLAVNYLRQNSISSYISTQETGVTRLFLPGTLCDTQIKTKYYNIDEYTVLNNFGDINLLQITQ